MTDNTQPKAGSTHIIRYALDLGLLWIDGDGRDKVREALDALDTLEAQLEAVGAGGVSGPLIGQPQAMPDLSQLTERGAKAWAGVDAQGLREGFTAADMATVSAQGFRDGVASVSAQAADSVQEDAALWHWLAEYLVGTRTDLDDEIVASETVNDLRKLVEAAIKQGEKQ